MLLVFCCLLSARRRCTSALVPMIDVELHRRFFSGLLCKSLRGETCQSFHSQRLLLMYFGVLGATTLRAPLTHPDSPFVDALERELKRCYQASSGAFGSEDDQSFVVQPTLTMTHCALYVLAVTGRLGRALDTWMCGEDVSMFVRRCQVHSGSMQGAFAAYPGSGETDVRFSFSALMSLKLVAARGERLTRCSLKRLAASTSSVDQILIDDAKSFVLRCWSPLEGGFGGSPGSEAHCGMTYCAVASLALLGWWDCDALFNRRVRRKVLGYCARRVSFGPESSEDDAPSEACFWQRVGGAFGFNGRPNKPSDTCYTFWTGAALRIVETAEGCDSLIDDGIVARFVLTCQGDVGGFGRDSGDVDPLHAALGLAGLATRFNLLTDECCSPTLDPVYSCAADGSCL